MALHQAHIGTVSGSPSERNAEDAALVAAAVADRAAFAPLYLAYVGPVYRACARRLGTREDAEDATAQIFIKVLAALPSYRADAPSFRSWLFTIVHHTLIDCERRRTPAAEWAAAAAAFDPDPGPEAVALGRETQAEVRALLAQVVPEQRRVLELRLAGLSTAEIASVVGQRQGAVRATQLRAIVRLRTILGGDPNGKDAR